MTAPTFHDAIWTLYGNLSEISANLAYVQQELPALKMDDDSRGAISRMCDEFNSALYDVRKEVRTLEDELRMHPGEEPLAPNVINHEPKARMLLIERGLRTEVATLDSVIKQLQEKAKGDVGLSAPSVLVTESGANILNAFVAIKDTLNQIAAKVDNSPDIHE